MTGPEQAARTRATKRLVMVVAGGIAGVAIALAAVYGINTIQRNAGDTACAGAAGQAQRLAPLAHGEVAAFAVADQPVRLPDLAFRDAGGNERHLSDWRGRTVLLNLWATWCIPCRKEMPALDALEGKLGGPNFQVVAISIDDMSSASSSTDSRAGRRTLLTCWLCIKVKSQARRLLPGAQWCCLVSARVSVSWTRSSARSMSRTSARA